MGSIEMIQRYAHLAPNHLTQHAMQIDAFLEGNGTNMAQGGFSGLVNTAWLLVPIIGVEPTTFALRMRCSTN